jgi:cation transport regulator ChaC
MDPLALDETLKLLNGLHDDLSKRNNIIKYIQENRKISVFAYGSLLWNPIGPINEIISDCILHQYTKGFFCEDFVYRGTTCFTGLTMGLQKDLQGTVNGALFISNGDQIIPFIKAFVKRETPINFNGTIMDIYSYDFVKVIMPDGINIEYALTCVVNIKSQFYLNQQLTLTEQAYKIGQAYGLNGTNFQYLEKLTNIYRQLNIYDTFTSDLKDLYDKVMLYRQSLSNNDHKWLQIYDQLQTLEERKEAVKTQSPVAFEAIIQSYSYSSVYFQTTNQQSQQVTSG